MIQQTMSIETDEYNQLVSQIARLTDSLKVREELWNSLWSAKEQETKRAEALFALADWWEDVARKKSLENDTLSKINELLDNRLIVLQETANSLQVALERLALLKEDIPDEMADNAFVFDVPVWLIRQVREDLESALSTAPAGSASR